MNNIINQLRLYGIIPIITINNPDVVKPVAEALLKARLPVLEITFRTDAAGEAIRIVSKEFPEILIGAGTVLTIETAQKAVFAGAKFILAPGFNPKVVDYCIQHDIAILPGINSPTQIEFALEKGLEVLKFFPSEASGGIELIKAMAAPFPKVRFIATGGIKSSNLASYMSCTRILACAGSWIASGSDIAAGRFDQIAENAVKSIQIMHGFRIKSVEIPGIEEEEFAVINRLFSGLLHQSPVKTEQGVQIADMLAFTRKKNPNSMGIICLETIDIERAMFYIQSQGYKVEKNEATQELMLSQNIGNYRIKITRKFP
ncbi:MAG: bifunctional 4-hydroxy-2-oxoglutarate aldolase/2-dehydro-3-deoxy-phosphogluconate aldolase [Spirochaetales bacterium]|nr:bifunctional 4-hydroxy-2-oxoglutarate aldolase/2-dehydro-3-deoxy-phosphogluconate aldolase [Spirochaetales bacterium]